MELADILAERAVLCCTGVTTKRQLFEDLAERAAEITGHDAAELLDAITSREELGSTGLGNGIAIPHGKVTGLKGVTALLARLDQPIDFDSVDDQPVDIVVMLLAPTGAGADHLKALSRIARVLRDADTVAKIRGTSDATAIHTFLSQAPASHAA